MIEVLFTSLSISSGDFFFPSRNTKKGKHLMVIISMKQQSVAISWKKLLFNSRGAERVKLIWFGFLAG